MAAMALLIREAGHHSRPVGVLVLTLSGMLLLRPAWALSIGFQLSAAATAGLILTAPCLEKAVQAWLPDRCQGLAAALSISLATALLVHGLVQLGDGLVTVERFDRHWLLARHCWRFALVSTHGDVLSCRMAKRFAAVHGLACLDLELLLDPVAKDVLACSLALAHC